MKFSPAIFRAFCLGAMGFSPVLVNAGEYFDDQIVVDDVAVDSSSLFDIHVAPQVDATFYQIDGSAPGFLLPDANEDWLFAPRLTLPVDVFLGDLIYGFGKFRFDTGFDPGLADHELRADEYYLRFGRADWPVQVQAGKYATVFGNWVQRHDHDDHAFITAPLAYNELTSVIDAKQFPGPAAIAANKGKFNNRAAWLPILWDASYVPGVALLGRHERFELAAEVKSRAISSRPESWENWDFADPTWTGRLGYRPDAAWNMGASMSYGDYGLGDGFDQTTAGLDLSYSHHHWQIWAELMYSEFELPNVPEDAGIWSYFIETRYKFTPQFFGAVRWNHQLYNELDIGGSSLAWDNDIYRIDTAVGYRINENLQMKLQYSRSHHDADFQNGENMVGIQFTARLR